MIIIEIIFIIQEKTLMSAYFFLDYLTDSSSLRRTVNNEYAPTPPPPPPVFSINPISPYTWVKSRNTNVTRIQARKSEVEKERERQRDYKLVARSAMVNNFVTFCEICKIVLINLIHITLIHITFLVLGKNCFTSL